MKKLLALLLVSGLAIGAPKVGEMAPNFTGTDSNGKSHSLSDFKGKIVVLEWVNYDCPFVKKHYKSQNMQELQAKYTKEGVIWLSINSSAKGKQGYLTPEEANSAMKERNASPTAMILDPSGEIGKLYNAKTTPHMFVIDAEGKLAYMGAIDDNDSSNPDDAKTAKNYVSTALDSLMSGSKIEVASTNPYGCSVKYSS
jgi:peroxiredoxin